MHVRLLVGAGTEENAEQAAHWFEQAARQGMPSAQSALGQCYEEGWGIAKNLKQALAWYELAAKKGNVDALKAVERLGSLSAVNSNQKSDGGKSLKVESSQSAVKILNLSTRITSTNLGFCDWSWQLKLQNNTKETVSPKARILFLDKDGFLLKSISIFDLSLRPGETRSFVGARELKIDISGRVKTVKPEIIQ